MEMDYRRLGHTGLKVSALGLGSWITFAGVLGRSDARRLVAQAYDAGINLFDSAENDAHGAAEALLGDVIADLRLPRDAICISSKACFGAVAAPRPTQRGLSRKHLREACDAALRRLRVDYLDLFSCHRPDPETPIEETVAAMDHLVQAGKVLYWGTSEWPAAAIRSAARVATAHGMVAPVAEQAEYNLLVRERVELEYAGLYDELGLGLTTGSPLLSGLLTGKYAGQACPDGSRLARSEHGWQEGMMYQGERAARERAVGVIVALAGELGCAPAALAIAWCLRNPRVSSVLLGCSSSTQLAENLEALRLSPMLDAAALARLDAIAA